MLPCQRTSCPVAWQDKTLGLAEHLKEAPVDPMSICEPKTEYWISFGFPKPPIEVPNCALSETSGSIWRLQNARTCYAAVCRGSGWTAFGSCRSWLIGICPRVQFHEHIHCACHMMSRGRKKWKTYHHTVWTQAQTRRFKCILGVLLIRYPLKSIDKQNMWIHVPWDPP